MRSKAESLSFIFLERRMASWVAVHHRDWAAAVTSNGRIFDLCKKEEDSAAGGRGRFRAPPRGWCW